MPKSFRAPAYPLMTIDPYISVWSCADTLDGDYTRHWTGRPAPIYLSAVIDGQLYRLCNIDKNHVNRNAEVRRFAQKSVTVAPLTTTYTFACDKAELTLRFTTPLLPGRLDILSRPVSYIEYDLKRTDGGEGATLRFGISSELCVNYADAQVEFKRTPCSLACGNTVQKPLSEPGDSVLINWGYLHLCDKDAYVAQDNFNKPADENKVYTAYTEQPYLMVEKQDAHGVITIAYDEIKPIEYFGVQVEEYYKKHFGSFEEMVKAAVEEYPAIRALCDELDAQLMAEAEQVGADYARIAAFAFRQAIAAHKIIADENGKVVWLSKECHSNGCIGTMDVTYPSIPLFLKYNPELVLGMLRPIIRYAESEAWPFDFAPHDVGQYPLANGQVYGDNALEMQMPIEESGNALVCVATAAKYAQDKSFFEENKAILKKWADYLVEYGYDPGNQLCTDDFAGHLAHNCNLSLKAIMGIAGLGIIYRMMGNEEKYDYYMAEAKDMAADWAERASNGDGSYRLAFDREGSFSMKYNIVWDVLFGTGIMDKRVIASETASYKKHINKYGLPLDNRADYTKSDWLVWCATLLDDRDYFEEMVNPLWDNYNSSRSRCPMTDWYDTVSSRQIGFRHRTVQGGLFIKLLDASGKMKLN